ncbi:MAG TPA: flavin reductase family protein [Actinomycetes bacterium]
MRSHPAPELRPTTAQFRAAMGRFATGVAVVTTVAAEFDHAMTANSFTSVSLEPLLTLVSVERLTRFHDAILESGLWTVSILPVQARETAVWLATKGRRLVDQLDRVPHRRSAVTGAAVVEGALAVVECATWATYDGGDHTLVVGEVLSVEVPDADSGPAPLLHHRGRYATLRPLQE